MTFFIPGSVVLKRFKLPFFDNLILSLIVGIAFWIWQGFIFGHLQIRWATYIYLSLFFLIWIKSSDIKEFFKKDFRLGQFSVVNLAIVFVLLLGTGYLLLTTFLNGVRVEKGLYFCCGLPDSLYHLALTNQLVREFPPIEPGVSGIIVQNYHYLGNLMVADFIRIFKLPLIASQYQYFVMFFSIMLGLVAISFSRIFKLGRRFLFWLLIFLYFSGDIIFLLTFLLGRGFDFSTPFLHHSGWLWVSPPRVFASVIFLGGLSLFGLWLRVKDVYLGLVLSALFSILVGVKIYVGIFALVGLAGLIFYFLIKKNFKFLYFPLFSILLALAIYFSTTNSSGGLEFVGLWRFENFISNPKLGLTDWELQRQTFLASGNTLRMIQYAMLFILIYFVSIFGMLILGFFQSIRTLRYLPAELNTFLFSGIIVCLIFGSFFIQSIGGANSSQFLITVMIILSIYAALSVNYWVNKLKFLGLILGVLIIILLTSRSIQFTKSQFEFQKVGGGHYVESAELEALKYLRDATPTSSIILADNINKNNWRNAYSHYISFLSDRQIFLDGEGITADHGVNVEQKLKDQREIFQSSDAAGVLELLFKNNISYIYMNSRDMLLGNWEKYSSEVFKNDKVKVIKIYN